MCAGAIGGPLKLKKLQNCILCAQSQGRPPPESLRKPFLILFRAFFFAPHRPFYRKRLLVRLFNSTPTTDLMRHNHN